MPDGEPGHYATVMRAMTEGRVVPLLGAGVNLAARPKGQAWKQGEYLPNGYELAKYLAGMFYFPERDGPEPPPRLAVRRREGRPRAALRRAPEALRRELPADAGARVLRHAPRHSSASCGTPQYQVILTTNYDDALERAFDAAKRAVRRHLVHRRPRAAGKVLASAARRASRADGDRTPERVRRAGDRRADGDPQDPRRRRPPERRPRQLRDHRGPLHRLPDQDGHRPADPGGAARQAHAEPVPLPRLQHAGLEPAGDPAPDLGPAAALVQVLGDPEGPERDRASSSGRRAASTCSTSRSRSTSPGSTARSSTRRRTAPGPARDPDRRGSAAGPVGRPGDAVRRADALHRA